MVCEDCVEKRVENIDDRAKRVYGGGWRDGGLCISQFSVKSGDEVRAKLLKTEPM